MLMQAEVEEFANLLGGCERAVVFTGAGISTESGIPDFRGPNGLWTRIKPIDFADYMASDELRQESWRQWFEHGRNVLGAQPNSGHLAVARLVEAGVVSAVITQNVDNLHQASGVPPEQVIELHGNATYARCLGCEREVSMATIEEEYRTSGAVGPCVECGGIVKSATISFGQAMPEDAMRRAEEETLACDLFVVLGSSLTVYPAAGFPMMAHNGGADLAIVNAQPTDMDRAASVVINESIGSTMAAVLDNAGVASRLEQ